MTKSKYLSYFFIITIFSMQGLACLINYVFDYSNQWTDYSQFAKLAIEEKIISVPPNYNEREFQNQIIKNLKKIPETIIIGSSRGMYLGKEILKQESLYNHCVSGGNLFDYFAILGLYKKYWNKIPNNIVIEASPWIFSDVSPEERWKENNCYRIASYDYYALLIGRKNPYLIKYLPYKSPLFSFTYMFTNLSKTFQNSLKFGIKKGLQVSSYIVHESNNESEQAELPDGTIRYNKEREKYSEDRRNKVISTSVGPVLYQDCNKMKEISQSKYYAFNKLIDNLIEQKIKVTIFLAPFSKSQCDWIYNKNSNPIFIDIENKLIELSQNSNIKIVGSYNSNNFNFTDDDFIDFMHGDKNLIKKIWNYKK